MPIELPKSIKLVYFLLKSRISATVTELMKLAYLSDLKLNRKSGEQYTEFKYVRYNFGPFDRNIYQVISNLASKGYLEERIEYTTSGKEHIVYTITEKAPESSLILEDSIIEILNPMLVELAPLGATTLTDLAYQTAPMKKIKAKRDNRLGINQVLDLNATIS